MPAAARPTATPTAASAMETSPDAPAGSGAKGAAAAGTACAAAGPHTLQQPGQRHRGPHGQRGLAPTREGPEHEGPIYVNFNNLKLSLGLGGLEAHALELRRHRMRSSAKGIGRRLHIRAWVRQQIRALRARISPTRAAATATSSSCAGRCGELIAPNGAPPLPLRQLPTLGVPGRGPNKLGPVATRAKARRSQGHTAFHVARRTVLEAQQVVAEAVREAARACPISAVVLEGHANLRALPSGCGITTGLIVATIASITGFTEVLSRTPGP